MAYVLGFFTADGCMIINPRRSHFIEFTNNDIDVLEKIKLAMNSGHKIGKKKSHKPNQKDSYRVQIGSKEIFDDLTKLGFTIRKTETVKLPKIPKKYFADYLRGYFDGDGCINFGRYNYQGRRNKKYHILFRVVCKNKQFLVDLAKQIKVLIETKGKTIFPHTRSFALAYSTKDSLKILKFIYKKPMIFMDRKFESSKKAIEQYNTIMDR